MKIKSITGEVLFEDDSDNIRDCLKNANLRGANLRDANLQDADLRDANLQDADLPHYKIVPEEGSFIAWKKARYDSLVKLRIPAKAKRTSSLISRKCRAEFVQVLAIYKDGKQIEKAHGNHDEKTIYKKGEYVYPDKYDPDPRVECSHGIHFFLTREEAEWWV